MKLAITSQGKTLDAQLDPRLGRCQYFVIVDTDTDQFEACENASRSATGGAGVQTAQFLADNGVEAVVTGNVGPNAMRALQAAGIKVYTVGPCQVREALSRFKQGQLQPVQNATVGSHFGMRR